MWVSLPLLVDPNPVVACAATVFLPTPRTGGGMTTTRGQSQRWGSRHRPAVQRGLPSVSKTLHDDPWSTLLGATVAAEVRCLHTRLRTCTVSSPCARQPGPRVSIVGTAVQCECQASQCDSERRDRRPRCFHSTIHWWRLSHYPNWRRLQRQHETATPIGERVGGHTGPCGAMLSAT